MHDGHKQIVELGEVGLLHQLKEPVLKDPDIRETVIGLNLSLLDFFLKLLKWLIISRFALKQELKDLLHLL